MSYPILQEGYNKLKDELATLEKQRHEIAQRLEDSRQQGDLAENAEYDAAREEQGLHEARIAIVEDKIARANIINPKKLPNKEVQFGLRVKVFNFDNDNECIYRIVSDEETSVENGKISLESPLARCLIGAKKGDIVGFTAPGGEREYEVLKILR